MQIQKSGTGGEKTSTLGARDAQGEVLLQRVVVGGCLTQHFVCDMLGVSSRCAHLIGQEGGVRHEALDIPLVTSNVCRVIL